MLAGPGFIFINNMLCSDFGIGVKILKLRVGCSLSVQMYAVQKRGGARMLNAILDNCVNKLLIYTYHNVMCVFKLVYIYRNEE